MDFLKDNMLTEILCFLTQQPGASLHVRARMVFLFLLPSMLLPLTYTVLQYNIDAVHD